MIVAAEKAIGALTRETKRSRYRGDQLPTNHVPRSVTEALLNFQLHCDGDASVE